MLMRPVTQADVKGILEIYNPFVESSPVTFEETSLTEEQMWDRIQKYVKHFPWLVAVNEQNEILGYAYASQHRERAAYRWCADVSVYIAEKARGQKLGEKLYTDLFKILKRQNYHLAYAIISLPNEASVGLHEKMGFTYVGTFKQAGFKLGKWHDVGWWQLVIQTSQHPQEPVPFPKL